QCVDSQGGKKRRGFFKRNMVASIGPVAQANFESRRSHEVYCCSRNDLCCRDFVNLANLALDVIEAKFVYALLCVFMWFSHRFKDRKSTRLNSSHVSISYAVFCLKKKTTCDSFSS